MQKCQDFYECYKTEKKIGGSFRNFGLYWLGLSSNTGDDRIIVQDELNDSAE